MRPASAPANEPAEREVLGLTLGTLNQDLREQLGLDRNAQGLLVTDVDPDSEAAAKGLQPGDLITEAGQQAVAGIGDLEDRIQEAREAGRRSILLLVRRDGEPRFIALGVEPS